MERAHRRPSVGRGIAACALALVLFVTGPATAQARPGKPDVDLSAAGQCDFIAQQEGSLCLLPFPNDYYTVRDRSTPTNRRLNLQTPAMPSNAAGAHIAASPYNATDGFSPGQPIVVRVPGLDNPAALSETGAVPINHLGR